MARSTTEKHMRDLQSPERWTNSQFLDALRREGDGLADQCFQELQEDLKEHDFSHLFKELNTNAQPLPQNIPTPLKRFIEQTARLPTINQQPVDLFRITRGQKAFMTHALPSALVLLTKSLPEGYAAPNLSKVLCLSDNLTKRPYRRLLGVLQMVVNVSSVGSFGPEGEALITIPKIRLLHAGVRSIVRKHCSSYESHFGVPVNVEDQLGTIMGFSYLVVDGLQQLEATLTDEEAEDFFYLWRVIAQMMGIHPPGEPDSAVFIPANLQEARVFFESYKRRHFVEQDKNPEGVMLAEANLQMLNDLLPQTPLRRLGLKMVPRMYMEELIGKEGCERIGIDPVWLFYATKWMLKHAPGIWTRLWDVRDRYYPSAPLHENISRLFFQQVINREFGEKVTFHVPDTLEELNRAH